MSKAEGTEIPGGGLDPAVYAKEASRSDHRRGVVFVLLAGVMWSLGGLLVRHVHTATDWQIIFYRSGGLAGAMLAILVLRYRGRVLRAIVAGGGPAVAAGACLAASSGAYIVSMTHSTVANTLFLLASAPLLSAVLGRLLLGERVRRATWATMVVAVLGIGIMVGDGLAVGNVTGNLMGLLSALGAAGFAVALRRGRQSDMLPAVFLAGLFLFFVASATAESYTVSFHDGALSLAMGTLQISLGLILFTVGSRQVPAAELTLLSLTEVILGPVWVWLGFGETPTTATLIGGLVLLGAIAAQALLGRRRFPPPIGAA